MIMGSVPIIKLTARETIVLKKAENLMLSIKYSAGSAANLILMPGIAKQIIKYVKMNVTINKMIDSVFFFMLMTS